jgi:hypothetical protein
LTQQNVVKFAIENKESLEYGMSCGTAVRKKALVPDAQYGALATLLHLLSPGMSEWEIFHERVSKGELLREGDPAFALRRWALNRRAISGSSNSQTVMGILTKAWNAHAEDRPVRKLSWRVDEMPMPNPVLSN